MHLIELWSSLWGTLHPTELRCTLWATLDSVSYAVPWEPRCPKWATLHPILIILGGLSAMDTFEQGGPAVERVHQVWRNAGSGLCQTDEHLSQVELFCNRRWRRKSFHWSTGSAHHLCQADKDLSQPKVCFKVLMVSYSLWFRFDLSIVWNKQSLLRFDLSYKWNKQRSLRFDLLKLWNKRVRFALIYKIFGIGKARFASILKNAKIETSFRCRWHCYSGWREFI